MTRKTSFEEIYTTISSIISSCTGRPCWRRVSMQAQPVRTYAVMFISGAVGIQQPVIEIEQYTPQNIPVTGEIFYQQPWNTSTLDVEIDFFRSATNDTALNAATRFISVMRLQDRFYDVWDICGLLGGFEIRDISSLFRSDTEPRSNVRFQIMANIADPPPLTGVPLFDINTDTINIEFDHLDGSKTNIPVNIQNNQ